MLEQVIWSFSLKSGTIQKMQKMTKYSYKEKLRSKKENNSEGYHADPPYIIQKQRHQCKSRHENTASAVGQN